MMTAKPCEQKPIGFRTAARMFQLSKPIDYRKQEFKVSSTGTEAVQGTTEFVVISPGIHKETNEPVTVVFPVNKAGYCLSWMGIGKSIKGHPEPAKVLKNLGYLLD